MVRKKKILKESEDAAIRGGYMDRVHHLKLELRDLLSQEEHYGSKDKKFLG